MPTGTLLEKTSRIIEGGLWVDEAEKLYNKHQTYLAERLTITPDVKQRIYPFKDVSLNRAEVAWLLKTHENGRGHVDWHDESQGKREGLDLRGADLRGVDLHDLPLARMRGGLAENEWLKATSEERKQAAVHLEDADLHGAHLEGADLRMAHLDRADLRTAHLEGADLCMAHLQEANLSGGGLEDAKLMGAKLQRAYLRAARLENADLREAHLEGARLFQSRLQYADLRDARLDRADLRGAVLLGANLRDARLDRADLRGAVLLGANLRDARLDRADLRGAILTEDQKDLLRDSNVIGLNETKDRFDSISRSSAEPPVVSGLEYQLEKILHEHVEMMLAGHSLKETLAQLLQGACKLAGVLPLVRDTIRVIDPDTLILQWDFLGDGQVLAYDNIPLNVGITGRAVDQRLEQIVDDVISDPDYISTDESVRSEMAVPLLIGDSCWGVLNLESDQPGYFHKGLLPWMQILASQAVLTIQYDAQRQRLHQIHTTNKGIEAMLYEQDTIPMHYARERVLRNLVDVAIKQTGSQFGSIMIAVQVPDGPARIEKDTQTEMVLLVAEP